MNTPKKEDILKEIAQIPDAIGMHAIRMLRPFVMICSAVARYTYLEEELRKVTPKPAPAEGEENAKVD